MNDELRKVQLLQLCIAKEIKRICEENNIQYALKAGSLLGAVRHKGFIPWDDDMDIGMERSEYEKFIKVAPGALKEDFFLQTWDTEEHYALPFGKVMLKDTLWVERFARNADISHCLYVDVFPIDPLPVSDAACEKQRKKIVFYRQLLLAKNRYDGLNYKKGIKRILFRLTKIPAIFCSNRKLKDAYMKTILEGYERDSDWYYAFGSQYSYKKGKMKKEWVTDFTPLKFEGESFLCPTDWKGNLEKLYGDYMKLPPVEKRRTHGVFQSDVSCYELDADSETGFRRVK